MFCSTTSKATNKTLPVSGRTRNVRTCQSKVSKVPKQNLSRRIRPVRNVPQGKQTSNFHDLYLHKIGTQYATSDHAQLKKIIVFIQALPLRQLRTNTSSHNSLNDSDFEKLNHLNLSQKEDDESESDSSTSNGDTNGKNKTTAMGSYSASAYLKRCQKPSDIYTQ